MIDSRLKNYFEDACDILDSLNIEYGPVRNVTVNSRAKTRWGQCRFNKRQNFFDIEISSRLLQNDVKYNHKMDTVIHELLHCHKDRMNHTGEWKRCANLVKMYYNYDITRTASAAEMNIEDERIAIAKYVVTCDTCGSVSRYLKKGKVVKLLMKHPKGACKCRICGKDSFTVEEVR